MVDHLSAQLAGFSIFSCIILLLAYVLFLPDMRKSISGKIACALLLASLALLQLAHYLYFTEGTPLLDHSFYGGLLMIIPSSFFFFSRVILFPDAKMKTLDIAHFTPLVLAIIVPIKLLPPVAFTFGTAYTFWFARAVFKLRGQGGRFKFEMFFFGMFALMALTALCLGLAIPYLDPSVFYFTYANAISVAVFLIVAALIFFPELLSDILLITELAYANSKLTGIDTDTKLQELDRLMTIEKHYQNEEISLANIAELLDLSSHQLSELINTKYQHGFPKFVREHRVREAKRLLISESSASILSISMMTGFKSQSNFYTAFKEITSESPGSYRKKYA